jgi:hypothetical protein
MHTDVNDRARAARHRARGSASYPRLLGAPGALGADASIAAQERTTLRPARWTPQAYRPIDIEELVEQESP